MLRTSFSVRALSHSPRLLRVTWGDGTESAYPSTWLRASVRDPQFFHDSCEYHPEHSDFIMKGLPIVAAEHITGQAAEENIRVQWEDHSSSFIVPWLRVQDAQSLPKLSRSIVEEKILWTSENELPHHEFSTKEERFESWMNDLRKWGAIRVHGCPPTEKGIVDFLTMVGPLWKRLYHPIDVCTLQATPKTKSVQLSYAVKNLEMHNNYIDYSPHPKLAAFLCTELNAPKLDTKTFLVDAFKVLEDIRQEDLETFHVLSTTPLRRARHRLTVEEECEPSEVRMYQRNFMYEEPVVNMDGNNIKWVRIRPGKDVGVSLVSHDDNFIMKYYDAYKKLQTLLADPKYKQGFVLQPGMMLVFDNYRVCHGRSEIDPSTHRVLKSAYVSEDSWHNRWRLLLGQRSGLDTIWLYGCTDEALAVLAQRKEDS